uniref:DNA translocase FtsK-like isoform X3 n=1 Tax=Geotrypetes seraphini TaxID=260995 RepID=A0A6P8QFH0_GEOSA|nr:DNA translocase FtsK-like isoform X3 [Geotrypetes seraphini]
MKIVTLFVCLFGAAYAVPLQVGLSLGLNGAAGGLVPLLQQIRNLNPFVPPVLEFVQQPQYPALPQSPFAVRIPFSSQLPNPIGPFPQGSLNGQQDSMQSQNSQQNQQQPNQPASNVIPYFPNSRALLLLPLQTPTTPNTLTSTEPAIDISSQKKDQHQSQ